MSDDRAEATVILVNVDADLAEFYSFAQRQALDLIGSAPPVWTWTLAHSEVIPAGAAEQALGRWPRHFLALETLGEALAEAVEESLNRPGLPAVGIVILARGPKSLLGTGEQTLDLPILAPLGKIMARDRGYRNRFWSIAALLDGPQDVMSDVRRLIARSADPAGGISGGRPANGFDTVVLLNPAIDSQTKLTSAAAQAGLRFVIDLIRGGDLWSALRPSGQGSRPRILWLRIENFQQNSRPLELRRAMTAAVERRRAAGADPKAEKDKRLEDMIEKVLGNLTQEAEPANPAMQLEVQLRSLPIKPHLNSRAALRAIDETETQLRGQLAGHYRQATAEIRKLQERGDARYATLRDDVERLQLPIADATLSGHTMAVVQHEMAKIEERRRGWSEAAGTARRALLNLHSEAQGRRDPVDPGEFAVDTFVPWRDFRAAIADAKAELQTLPPSALSWIWVWVPAVIFLSIVGLDLVDDPAKVEALNLASLVHPNPMWIGTGFAFALAIVYVLIARRNRRLYRVAAQLAASSAQAAVVALNGALAATQALIANSRAAPLAEQLLARLRDASERSPQQFVADFDRLKAQGLGAGDPKTMAALSAVMQDFSIDRWLREMTRVWSLANPPTSYARLSVKSIPAAHPFAIDESAVRQESLSIQSTWATEDFEVVAVPLSPVADSNGPPIPLTVNEEGDGAARRR